MSETKLLHCTPRPTRMASFLHLGARLAVRKAKCATASEATKRSRTAYSHHLPLTLARTTQYQFCSVRMQRGQWRMMPQSWCSLARAQSLRTVRASSQKQSPRRSAAMDFSGNTRTRSCILFPATRYGRGIPPPPRPAAGPAGPKRSSRQLDASSPDGLTDGVFTFSLSLPPAAAPPAPW